MWAKELPPVLSEKEEKELFERYRNGDREAKEKLIVHNLRFVVHVCKKYPIPEIEHEDLLSIGSLGLHKAVENFKPDKGYKLSSYAAMCIKNEILMATRKTKRIQEVSFDVAVHRDSNGNELKLEEVLLAEKDEVDRLVEKQMERYLLMDHISGLSPRNQGIMNDLLGLAGIAPLTQREVGKKYGLSQVTVAKIRAKTIEEMKKKFAMVGG